MASSEGRNRALAAVHDFYAVLDNLDNLPRLRSKLAPEFEVFGQFRDWGTLRAALTRIRTRDEPSSHYLLDAAVDGADRLRTNLVWLRRKPQEAIEEVALVQGRFAFDGLDAESVKIRRYVPTVLPQSTLIVTATHLPCDQDNIDPTRLTLTVNTTGKSASAWAPPLVFDVPTSVSQLEPLVAGVFYHLTPGFDWDSGVTLALVAPKKPGLSRVAFQRELAIHLIKARDILVPQGLRGYMVYAGHNFEVALLNFEHPEAQGEIWQSPESAPASEHAATFLGQPLLYMEPIDTLGKQPRAVNENDDDN